MEEYRIINKKYNTIYHVQDSNDKHYALKILGKNEKHNSSEKELGIHELLQSKMPEYIVNIHEQFTEIIQDQLFHCIIMDLYQYDLYSYKYELFQKDEILMKQYIRELLYGVHMMHDNGIIHGDLKLENIILTNDKKHIKIIDFGLSKYINDYDNTEQIGTIEYLSPEMILYHDTFDERHDIWCIGIICVELFYSENPFFPNKYPENKKVKFCNNVVSLKMNNTYDDNFMKFLKKIICYKNDRSNVYDLLNHPFLN